MDLVEGVVVAFRRCKQTENGKRGLSLPSYYCCFSFSFRLLVIVLVIPKLDRYGGSVSCSFFLSVK